MISRAVDWSRSMTLMALLIVCAGASLALADISIEQCGIEATRLPPLVVPEHYELLLNASNLAQARFVGHVSIRARYTDVLPSTPKVTFLGLLKKLCKSMLVCRMSRDQLRRRQILLNVGRSLQIDSVLVERSALLSADETIQDEDEEAEAEAEAEAKAKAKAREGANTGLGVPLAIDEICLDKANQVMAITLAERPAKDELLTIHIDYRGKISARGDSRGLYQSLNRASEDDHSERASTVASFIETASANTHSFPANARTSFPCLDQPDLKATFSLRLVFDKDLTAVSNMPLVSSQLAGETGLFRLVQFATTPRMSSYLLAFAIGHYETISCQAEGRTRPLVTAFAPPGRAKEAQFTLDAVCRAIPLAETYMRREFPMSKLDLVSVRQMTDPARENWGMIVFTEEFLLTSDIDTTLILREEIAKLAVHVVLHHWWGNLVTASWWDDQWLFDGFTIWRSHVLADELYPKFNYDFNYLLRLQSPMLDAHTSGSVRPIKTYQELSADEELKLFDVNIYNKAGALFHMTHAWLGEYLLRDSLVLFQDRNVYSNANLHDLMNSLHSMSDLDTDIYLNSWLNLAGVPLVSVSRVGRNELELSQERLLSGPVTWRSQEDEAALAKGKEPKAAIWTIPINIVFSDSRNMSETVRTTLTEARKRVQGPAWFRHHERGHWFKLNLNFNSFYRVHYPQNVLSYLQAPVEERLLSPQDRFNIIDDMRALYTLGRITLDELQQVLDWYKNEKHGGVLSGLALVVDALSTRESKSKVDEIALRLFGPVFEQHRFRMHGGESHAQLNGRQDALVRLIKHDHEPALDEALHVFDASDVHLEPALRRPIYLAVLMRGSRNQLDELMKRIRETRSDLERSILVNYLVQFVPENNAGLKTELMATLGSKDA